MLYQLFSLPLTDKKDRQWRQSRSKEELVQPELIEVTELGNAEESGVQGGCLPQPTKACRSLHFLIAYISFVRPLQNERCWENAASRGAGRRAGPVS